MRGEFVEVVNEGIDTGFEDSGHGHGGNGHEEAGDGGEEAGPDAVGEVGRGDGFAEFGDFGKGDDHPPDGAEEANEGRDGCDEGEDTEAAFMLLDDAGSFAFGDIKGVLDTALSFIHEDTADPHEGIGGIFEWCRALQSLDGAGNAVTAHGVVDEAFQNDHDRDDGKDEKGPHEAAAFVKEILERKFHERVMEVGPGFLQAEVRICGDGALNFHSNNP